MNPPLPLSYSSSLQRQPIGEFKVFITTLPPAFAEQISEDTENIKLHLSPLSFLEESLEY